MVFFDFLKNPYLVMKGFNANCKVNRRRKKARPGTMTEQAKFNKPAKT